MGYASLVLARVIGEWVTTLGLGFLEPSVAVEVWCLALGCSVTAYIYTVAYLEHVSW
jgi:hypothetical protein